MKIRVKGDNKNISDNYHMKNEQQSIEGKVESCLTFILNFNDIFFDNFHFLHP